jgi:hypothetical protein
MILKHEINSFHREKYIKIKSWLFNLLMFGFSLVCYLFPDPKKNTVFDRNVVTLLEYLDLYNEYEGNPRCRVIVNAVVRIVTTLMEHSPNWRDRIYWWGEQIRKGEWNRRALNHPRNGWKEQKPYGG